MQVGREVLNLEQCMLTVNTRDGTGPVFYLHECDLTAMCVAGDKVMVGDVNGQVFSLNLSEGGDFWEVETHVASREGHASSHTEGRGAQFEAFLITGFDGKTVFIQLTPEVMRFTVGEMVTGLGPNFRDPQAIQVGGQRVDKTTRISEIQNGTILTLLGLLQGGGHGGMPAKSGKKQAGAQQGEFLTNMAKLNSQFKREEVAELLAKDKELGETMGVGAEKRRLKAQEEASEKKRTEEKEKREAAAAKAQKHDQTVDKLAQLSLEVRDKTSR
jgi:hypothetical protein